MMQKAIVSTDIGAEGIQCKNGESIALANDAATFSSAIINLLQNEDLQMNIAQEARHIAMQHYSSMQVTTDLIQFYKTQVL